MANTRECVAPLLRPGNAPPSDLADHKTVLAAALQQLPLPLWAKLLIRIDGAAFSHEVLDHLTALTRSRRGAPPGDQHHRRGRHRPAARTQWPRCGRTAPCTKSSAPTVNSCPTRSLS